MSEYSRVLILPTSGVLLYGVWRAVILMIYSVDGLRPEEINVDVSARHLAKVI